MSAPKPTPAKKICRRCKAELPISAFYVAYVYNERPTYASSCKGCDKQRSAERNRKRPIQRKSIELRHRYGISLDEYQERLASQDGCCAICRLPAREMSKQLAVDHCHETGAIRGLLCSSCNFGLGAFKDNPEHLQRAALYLKSRA